MNFTTTNSRTAATALIVGGALWAVFPVGTPALSLEDAGAATFPYAVAYYTVMAVLPLLLLAAGIITLARGTSRDSGKLVRAGFAVTSLGVFAMFAGNAIEVATLAVIGQKSAVGHMAFLFGFLGSLVGSAILGAGMWRSSRDRATRIGAAVLMGLLPLGFALGAALAPIAPQSDMGFWAAISVPTSMAWIILGARMLRSGGHAAPAAAAA